jgi:hypothetical protein
MPTRAALRHVLVAGDILVDRHLSMRGARCGERAIEAKHDGWMSHRARRGWRYGEARRDEARVHPAMRPYVEISHPDKDGDSVLHYPAFAARAYQRIVRLS